MTRSAIPALAKLEGIVGPAHLVADSALLAGYRVDDLQPSIAVRPRSVEEVAEVVRHAAAEKLALIAVGGRTKLRIGAPPRRYDVALDLAQLNRILAYDPGDLTLGVEPGVRFAQLTAALAEHAQFVPLAPAFADEATIGGIVATNSGSPLRHGYGSARDYVLGMEFVAGDGGLVKSGGRVVKNVTGYDLHKLMIGALGTLGIITRVNFKTFPLPRAQAVFVASFQKAAEALAMCSSIVRSPLQPRLVEVVEPQAARILDIDGKLLPEGLWSAVVAAAGDERIVQRHARDLGEMARCQRAAHFGSLAEPQRAALLNRVREFTKHMTEFTPAATILRINVLPTQMSRLLEQAKQIAERNHIRSAALVRAVGTIYLALLPPAELNPDVLERVAQTAKELIRASAASEIAARAVIEWCPTALKRMVDVWGPVREDFKLMQRLKKVFDPHDIFSPGRFVGGI